MADEKQYLRTILSEARSGLSTVRAAELSERVQTRLLAARAYRESTAVVLYASVGSEVQTDLIAVATLRAGRRLYYPLIDRKLHRLRFAAVTTLADLKPGSFGIPQPPAANALDPEEIGPAMVCVAGVAFTPQGVRLGRGGGYYDRTLAAMAAGSVAAGLCYSFQLIDRLPEEAHDRRLDLVVTESAVYAASDAPRAAAQPADQGGKPKWTC